MKLSKFLRHRSDGFHSAGLERMVDGFERRGNLTTIDCGYVRLRSITDGEEEVFQTGGKRAAQTTEDFSGQESFGIGEFFSRADFDGSHFRSICRWPAEPITSIKESTIDGKVLG